jgi:hypothetical protein
MWGTKLVMAERDRQLDGMAKARERERGRERYEREKVRREQAKRMPKPVNPDSGSWRGAYEPWSDDDLKPKT